MFPRTVLPAIGITSLLLMACSAAHAQDWHINGNPGTNPGANFVGTTDNTALVLRTGNVPRVWINGSAPVYSGSGHVGIGFGLNSPEALLHIYNYDNSPTITDDLIVSHRGASAGSGGTGISLRVLGNEMASIQTQNDAPDGGSLRFRTRNAATVAERMRITNDGNVGIGTSQPNHPLDVKGLQAGDGITFRHVTGPGRAAVSTSNAGAAGAVASLGPSGNFNAGMGGTANNSDNGFVAVFDAAETGKAFMLVDTDGRGFVVADVKSFRAPNPGQPGTSIVYAAIEGPEAAAYVRGTARLRGGTAIIDLPAHFVSVVSQQGLTVQVTPSSARSLGLAVTERSTSRIVVREVRGGKGDYDFDWEVKGIRKGYEGYRVVRSDKELSIGAIDGRRPSSQAK